MSESRSNGHDRWANGDDVAAEAYERLISTGGGQEHSGGAQANGNGAARRAEEVEEPPHKAKRHPEDPPGAYQGAAEEVCDPEQIRRNAERFGKASQAIDPEWFEWLARPLYRGVHDVRTGAIVGPARREVGEQLKVAASTEAAIAEIEQEGIADGEKADRLKAEVIPRVEQDLSDSEAKEKAAEERVAAAREDVSRVRAEEEERRARLKLEPRESMWRRWLRESGANLFSRVRFTAGKAWLVFLVEMIGSAFLLAPDVADVINTSYESGLAISAVISIAMLAAAFAAGMGLAAVRLPGWVVGLSIGAAFSAILVKFVPALDALRLAKDTGVETLTAATLAAFLIAMVSGYALATSDDQRRALEEEDEEHELLKRAGTPLGDALDVLAEEKEKHQEAKKDRNRLEELLAALWAKVEDLRDKASRAGADAERRRQKGIEAEVEAETVRAIAESGIEQERAAAEWAYLIALASQEKARVEELPRVPETPRPAVRAEAVESGGRSGLSLLQILALLIAAAGGVASLFLGLIPLGVSIPIAALLVLLDRQRDARRGPKEDRVPPAPPDQRPRIVTPADDENPLYIHQPDHMVPKYRDGGAGTGERQ
jgi:hypothetical protein